MKLTTIFLIVSLFQVQANSYGQNTKLTLNFNDTSVSEIFNEIETVSEFRFLYESNQIDLQRKASLKVTKGKISNILDLLFENTNIDYKINGRQVILTPKKVQKIILEKSIQEKEVDDLAGVLQHIVSGTVVDDQGAPLPGASIVEKGTTNGTQTDFDGNFSIAVADENAVLVVSYVGFAAKEILVNGQINITVVIEESTAGLDEVVVIGYGTMKKSDLTGSVVRADIEAFRSQPNVSIVQSLQGSVPGLNIGAVNTAGGSPEISLRGLNTLSGSTSPLIVLDGIIYNGNLADLNPDDIESIDVLKDASSKAIYGSQAANGVLLITSKMGSKGRKPKFTYSTYYSSQTPSNILTRMNREQYIQKTKDAFYQQAYLAPEYVQENPDFDPILRITDLNSKLGFGSGADVDWVDLITQTGYITNHNINMAGSTETLSYYLSGGYTDQQGYIKGDTYDRISLRANFDNKVTDWINIGFQSFITSADYSGQSAGGRIAYLMPAVNVPYDENGELIEYPHFSLRNPLYNLLNDDLDKQLNLFAKAYAKIDIPYVNGLTYTLNYSTNYRTTRQYGFNRYAQNNTGSGYKNNGVDQDYTIDNILSYNRTIAENHKIDLTALYGQQKLWGDGTNASAAIFLNDALGYNSLESGDVGQRDISSSAYDEYSLYQMGRIHYGYKSKYLLTGTIRRDGFSGFGSNKKFAVFPSVAVAWVASNEKFMADALPIVNNLKVRASFGESGNRTIGRYGTLSQVTAGYLTNFDDKSAYGQYIANLANNDLGWETTTGLNMGLDFALFKGRINGMVDYYIDKTNDILFNVNIPYMTGFGSVLSNIGEIKNNGLEISLNTINIRAGDFVWESTLNFSTNSNEIVSILGKDEDGDGVEDDIIGNSLFIGKARGAIYHYTTDGIYQLGDEFPNGYRAGNYIVRDISGPDGEPDGLISATDDRSIIGYTEPAYRFSIYNNLSYKDLSFSFFVNSVQGGKDGYYGNITPSDGSWIGTSLLESSIINEWDYWTPNNPDARFQGISSSGAVNPNQYAQRSFIRLQDVSLSYNFKTIATKIGLNGAEIHVSGKNLLTITDWIGTDPELGLGLSPGHMPLQKSISLGLNVTF